MYTKPSDVAKLVPHELAAELKRTVEEGFHALCRIPQPLASRSLGTGKWSPKQIVRPSDRFCGEQPAAVRAAAN